MAGGEGVLTIRALRHCYGEIEAVAGVDLEVGAGEVVALLGPNGAGKSTTLAVVLGLLHPSGGEVTVLGRAPGEAIGEGLIGALLQSGAGSGMPPGARVGELVRFVTSLYPRPFSVSTVLDAAGLCALESRKVDGLSGGELQRVRFALAICPDPRLLVLDEPTVGLDVPSRRAFWRTVTNFAASGRTVLFATHYLAEVDEVAERVVVMLKGQVVADGPVDDIRRMVATKHIRFRAEGAQRAQLAGLPAVTGVECEGSAVTLASADADQTVGGLYRSGIVFTDLEVVGADLEEAFLELTGLGPGR